MTLFSVAFLGVSFDFASLTAIPAISLGILRMAAKGSAAGRMRGKALFYAIGTAVFTASYTLVGGIGARTAGTSFGFILWMVLGDAVGMVFCTDGPVGRPHFPHYYLLGKQGAAGAMSLGSCWVAAWAFTQAPIALVAALRVFRPTCGNDRQSLRPIRQGKT
ncbi:hypothetical protein HW561_22985 [Rhodobacteraceae bacterium B1Z28]|uniref:Uncharacterized protein n=1 Tax=Ruegeria haliotis TaxID=2747601 RepID=A0ABX2PWW4_9RHOB|nr:hypothetical protein [Ruegeria haliotis]NVO58646.1 hypothetical protein [Ruegeria haliotis]